MKFALLVALLSSSSALAAFPADWIGHWKGKCETVKMELEVARISAQRYRWVIRYTGQPDRNYELEKVGNNHFLLDEKNGIFIDSYIRGNVSWSMFDVSGTRIVVREEVQGDSMRVEMPAFTTESVRDSGTDGNAVSAYGLKAGQDCLLFR